MIEICDQINIFELLSALELVLFIKLFSKELSQKIRFEGSMRMVATTIKGYFMIASYKASLTILNRLDV